MITLCPLAWIKKHGLYVLKDNYPELWAYRMIEAFQFLRDYKIMQKAGGLEDQDDVYLAAMQYMQNLVPEKTIDAIS